MNSGNWNQGKEAGRMERPAHLTMDGAQKPAREASPLEGCLSRLGVTISDLRRLRCALTDRLQPVLAPRPPGNENEKDPASNNSGSPLEASLAQACVEIQREAIEINDLLQRLRL